MSLTARKNRSRVGRESCRITNAAIDIDNEGQFHYDAGQLPVTY